MLTLARMADVVGSRQLEDVVTNVESNTRQLVDASAATNRASESLAVMQARFFVCHAIKCSLDVCPSGIHIGFVRASLGHTLLNFVAAAGHHGGRFRI